MDIRHLRSFVAVVEEGSFTRAAERVYSSQPSVSTHIRKLEEQLGVRLIIRDTKNIRITKRGWELYECAKSMLELQDKLVQRWQAGKRHLLHLGASSIPSAYLLPELLPRYQEADPEAAFVMQQGDSSEIIRGVEEGRFDLGMIGKPYESKGMACLPFYQDRMVLVTPKSKGYERLKEERLSSQKLKELLQAPMIMREQGSATQGVVEALLKQLGLESSSMDIVARLNDQEAIKNLVAEGLGLSMLSHKAAEKEIKAGALLSFELDEALALRQFYVIFHHEGHALAHREHFVQFVLDFYA